MAKFIEAKPPTQPTYVFEFTQEEVDVLGGLTLDLADKNRKVRMDYTVDESIVVPSARGRQILQDVADALDSVNSSGNPDYDYFDFWDEVDR